MKQLAQRYQQQLRYLFFGVLTTIVNYVGFWLLITAFGAHFALAANAGAFVLATAFAYLTNKCFVFKSKLWDRKTLVREGTSFLGARLLSFGVEEAGLLACILFLPLERWMLFGLSGMMLAKIALSFISVLLNYIFSKRFVFHERKENNG